MSPRLAAREVHATLRFAPHRIAAENVGGTLAGGALKGSIVVRRRFDGVSAAVTVSLAKADATALIAAGARPPLSGTIGLELSVDGSGLSPAALIGSLAGTGKISLDRAQFAGLDPRAFDAVTRAVDQGVPIEGGRIADVVAKALESGQLSVKHAEGAIVVGAGQLRLRTAQARARMPTQHCPGALDLTNGALDGRLVLSGATGPRARARTSTWR